VPRAVGAALAGRYDGTDRLAAVVFGDGAMNQRLGLDETPARPRAAR
jgi:TPP-dependent pyruvate/acetoin dehydrogenase alpha subunit